MEKGKNGPAKAEKGKHLSKAYEAVGKSVHRTHDMLHKKVLAPKKGKK